ncbi:MAG: hypothetical protein V4858_10355 [Pseudomonadota bacterium]
MPSSFRPTQALKASAMVFCLCALSAYSLELELPLDPSDAAANFLSVTGFGYHVAEHRLDGHPGLDFEFKLGGKVRAAHAGQLNFFADAHDPSKLTVQVDFSADGKNWRNVYTNVGSLEPGLAKGSALVAGQAIGTAGTVTATGSGGAVIQYAMTHFQLDDMSGAVNHGLSNKTALSPVPFFSASAQSAFAALVEKSTYHQQLCEPFISSARGLLAYPSLVRTWTLAQGSHGTRIDFTCDHSATQSSYRYALLDATNTVLETGAVSTDSTLSALPKIDFTAANGSKRLGVYAVNAITGVLTLDYSAPGGSRPTSFGGASSYRSEGGLTACAVSSDAVCLVGESSPYRLGQQINLSLAVRADKLAGAPASVEVWAAVAMPDGSLWYITAAGLDHTPAPLRSAQALSSGQSTVVPLVIAVPVTTALAGQYTVYGGVVPVGTPVAQLLAAKLGNLLTVSSAIQP